MLEYSVVRPALMDGSLNAAERARNGSACPLAATRNNAGMARAATALIALSVARLNDPQRLGFETGVVRFTEADQDGFAGIGERTFD